MAKALQQRKNNLPEVPGSRQWYSRPLSTSRKPIDAKALFPPAVPQSSPASVPISYKKTDGGAARRTRKHTKVLTTADRRRGREAPLECEIRKSKADRRGKSQGSQWQEEGNPRRQAQSKSAARGHLGKGTARDGSGTARDGLGRRKQDGSGRRKQDGTKKHKTARPKANEKTQETSKPGISPLAPGASVPINERAQLMQPLHLVHTHSFYDTLREWESGVPVDCGPDWSREAIDLAIQKGPHRSALDSATMQTVHEDVNYQVEAGFSSIVLWDDIKDALPKRLKISPLAVVPQKDRRGRLILDLSFAVHLPSKARHKLGEAMQESVNDSTVQQSPQEPVREIGNVLKRMCRLLAEVPDKEDVMLSKIDLSDGFWRVRVEDKDSWNFAYVLPDVPGAPLRLVIPCSLQMGWSESPAYFCAVTETTRDLIQETLDLGTELPPHRLEEYMLPTRPAKRQKMGTTTWQESYVYIDDFCLAAVESPDGQLLKRVARAALHGIHAVFPPPERSGHTNGKDPVSQKKLEKGDARWMLRKTILGFLLDGRHRTVELPADKAADILKEVKAITRKSQVPLKRFQKIVGKLRHVAIILPAAKGMFTPINDAMKGSPKSIGLPKNGTVRVALLDLAKLTKKLAERPTHVREIVPQPPDYIGLCDASGFGAGGVWFGGEKGLDPVIWRVDFPKQIRDALVSDANPKGTLTNSDLEMAGTLLQAIVLEQVTNMRHAHALTFCDNTPAVSWATRMASKSQSPIAGRLIRGLALRQRTVQSAPLQVLHVPGEQNILADTASRLAKMLRPLASVRNDGNLDDLPEITDAEFLTHFNSKFPLAQGASWRVVRPPSELLSLVMSTLEGRPSSTKFWTQPPGTSHGKTGPPTSNAAPPAKTHGCGIWESSKSRSFSLPLLHESEQGFSAGCGKWECNPSKQRCVTWRKPSSWQDSPTPDVK